MTETPTSTPVILTNEQQPVLENSKPKSFSTAPKWETAARERMRAAIKKFAKPLADLVARDANEGDTRLLVTDMLCEGFGFDKYSELTTEYRVKGEFADYGIRLDKEIDCLSRGETGNYEISRKKSSSSRDVCSKRRSRMGHSY